MSVANPYSDFPMSGPGGGSGGALIPIPDHIADQIGAPHGLYYKPSSVPGHAPQYNQGEGALYQADGSVYYNRTVLDKLIPWISAGILGTIGMSGLGMALGGGGGALASSPLPSNMAGLSPAVSGSVPTGAGLTSLGPSGLLASAPVGSGMLPSAPLGASLASSPLPSNAAGLAPSLGGGNTAALNANAAAAATGSGAARGAAAVAGGEAARTMKDKLIDSIPLLAGAMFGSQGPFGHGNTSGSNQNAEMEGILELMKQRLQAQGPLFTAVNQGAYNLLPNSAKQGGMFTLPSSTNAGY